MQIGLRVLTGAALSLAMLAGDVSTLSLTPSAASAAGRGGGGFHGGGGYRGGGYGGYRGGYGGYRGYGGYYGGYGGFGFGDFLLGAAIVGGVAAVASADSYPYYDGGYTNYQTYPAPVYSAPQAYAPPGAYAPPAGYAPQGNYAPSGEYADNNGYAEGQAQAAPSNDPVEQCSRAAERQGQARGGYARVVGIDHVDPRQNGAKVVGMLEVSGPRDNGGGNGSTLRTKFSCTADYGQITALRLG